ncbi:hypothetical protein AZL_002640 [Azospirillum sp. B510]|uniref:DUF4424 family protein n=1 Tax=Azospirillum sp. (strain B510) TaxID=137722 RepID=UPI0001C4C2C5|nr:DUF4424 family protein [Azospirillum sp. B510]BAI70902.1 hypothetical protein AZL_002640 [Azospirillum sp. B510]
MAAKQRSGKGGMMGGKGIGWGVLLAMLVLPAAGGGASANDSTGFQGTGGIELTRTDAIEMRSEDLWIGMDEIRVSYVFRNVSDRPVETLVAFPLPDLDLSPGLTASAWQFPKEADDFLDFRLWIDDRPEKPSLERRALFQGRDVTAAVEAAGALGMTPWAPGAYDDYARTLDPAALARLRDAGLIQNGDYNNNPQWTLRTRYFWTQTFPPGRDVRVRHVYRTFLGHSLLGDVRKIDARGVVGRLVGEAAGGGAGADRYCLEESARRTVVAVQAKYPSPAMPYGTAEIEYILTTARNWRGPIGRFHLTIDKGAPENIVSLCWNGLSKTGPTTFESTITDFVPDRDIRLLLFVRAKAP